MFKSKEDLFENDKDKSKPNPKDKLAVTKMCSYNNGLQWGINKAFQSIAERIEFYLRYRNNEVLLEKEKPDIWKQCEYNGYKDWLFNYCFKDGLK